MKEYLSTITFIFSVILICIFTNFFHSTKNISFRKTSFLTSLFFPQTLRFFFQIYNLYILNITNKTLHK